MAKFVTAQEAVQYIHSGDRVALAHSVGEPQALVNAMLDNYQAYQQVEICHMLALGPCKYTRPEMAGHFWHNSLFAGPGSRDAVNEGRADYTPNLFGESPRLFYEGFLPIDVALITLSPPDERGYCSYGVTVDYTKCITECAKLVIAQINRYMPRTYGDTLVHIDDIDLAVECDEPLFHRPVLPVGEIEERIGQHCASLIEDGAAIQLGIGTIPDAILHFLGEKNDLGVHSEMLCDGALGLLKAGNINNSRKQINKGVSVVTYLYGRDELYEYAHLNPKLQIFPVNYVNDPRIIGSKILPDGTYKKGIGNFIRDWSIDEFPQFFNVLKGDISLVGTRPPLVSEVEQYELRHCTRLAMKPGITGMWQISGRSSITDFDEVVKLDREYIENWNFGKDLRILWKTVGAVLKKDGAV